MRKIEKRVTADCHCLLPTVSLQCKLDGVVGTRRACRTHVVLAIEGLLFLKRLPAELTLLLVEQIVQRGAHVFAPFRFGFPQEIAVRVGLAAGAFAENDAALDGAATPGLQRCA